MSVFELLRDRLPVEEVVSHVSEVQAQKARCVSGRHADKNPSMYLYGDHVHCYVCRFHADVTGVWAAAHRIENQMEAARDLAREFDIELPKGDLEAQRKAQEGREKEDLYLKQARACHLALNEHPNVSEWWEGRGFGKELREQFLLGANNDGSEAVIPFWHKGRVKGLIRRKLEGEPRYRYPKAEDFPEGYRPLVIPGGPVRPGAYLLEGIVDALAVAALGESAIAVGGTGISEDQMSELSRLPEPLYILPDADEEGKKAAREWARKLYPKVRLCSAEYGEGMKDAADLFAGESEEEACKVLRD